MILRVVLLFFLCLVAEGGAQQKYSLNFSRSSTRTQWSHRLPSWQYKVPVRLAATGDSTSKLSISTSASMRFTLDDRNDRKTWQDNASISSTVNYPILGPKATIGIGANMSVRSSTLQQQKLRDQAFNFRFQYKPLERGRFKDLSVNVTPGLITKTRDSRANLDSTIEETGVQYNASLRVSPDIHIAGKKLGNSLSFSKRDNTLKNNKDRSESFSSNASYTLPGDARATISFSESRSEFGITRSVIDEEQVDGFVRRDTSVAAEISESRNTRVSSSLNFDLGRFKIRNTAGYGENLRTNTASAELDAGNRYFGTDRESKNWNWQSDISGKIIEAVVISSKLSFEGGDQRNLAVRVVDASRCASHFVISLDGTCRDPSSDLSNKRLFLNTSLTWTLAEKHSLRLSTWADIKQAENPGAAEQDRDTYSNSLTVHYDGTLASGTRINAELRNSFLHRVNLAATRSGDNSRNRDIVLDMGSSYERLGMSVTHNFSISAKRTIFDFDRELNRRISSRKSNIRRGWSMNHSVRRRVLNHVTLNSRYSYSADDFGTLIVENGAQVVEEDNNRHSVGLGMSYSPSQALSLTTNYSFLLDRRWEHEYADSEELRVADRARRNRNRSLSMSLSYNPTDSPNQLSMRGSRSRQRSGTFDTFNVTYSRAL